MNEDLLPCPFCGGAPKVETAKWGTTFSIACRNTKCFGPSTPYYGNESDAIAAWNRRSTIGGEPVAWMVRGTHEHGTKTYTHGTERGASAVADDWRNAGWSVSIAPLFAHPAPSTGEVVKVKPLKWPETITRGHRIKSMGGLVQYTIAHYGSTGLPALFRWAGPGDSWSEALRTYEEAQAAAQADYEARIRSALE